LKLRYRLLKLINESWQEETLRAELRHTQMVLVFSWATTGEERTMWCSLVHTKRYWRWTVFHNPVNRENCDRGVI